MTRPNIIRESFPRVRPRITSRNSHFWQSGAEGVLQLGRCRACRTFQHPPSPVCHACRSMDVAPEAVSGRGVVHAFTINRYRWLPDMEPPYVVAEIELVEQEGLRLLSNVVGCPLEAVHTGMEVEVVFAANDDVHVPLFRPVGDP